MHGAFPKGGFTTTPSYDSRAVLKTHFLCLDFALDSPRQALYLESVIQTRVFSLEEGGCGRFLSSPNQGQEESFYKRLLEEGPARPSTGLLQVTLSMAQRREPFASTWPACLPHPEDFRDARNTSVRETEFFLKFHNFFLVLMMSISDAE